MCTEKHVLVKKTFTNRQNMGMPLLTWVKNTVDGVETYWLSGKEKVPGEEGYADSF